MTSRNDTAVVGTIENSGSYFLIFVGIKNNNSTDKSFSTYPLVYNTSTLKYCSVESAISALAGYKNTEIPSNISFHKFQVGENGDINAYDYYSNDKKGKLGTYTANNTINLHCYTENDQEYIKPISIQNDDSKLKLDYTHYSFRIIKGQLSDNPTPLLSTGQSGYAYSIMNDTNIISSVPYMPVQSSSSQISNLNVEIDHYSSTGIISDEYYKGLPYGFGESETIIVPKIYNTTTSTYFTFLPITWYSRVDGSLIDCIVDNTNILYHQCQYLDPSSNDYPWVLDKCNKGNYGYTSSENLAKGRCQLYYMGSSSCGKRNYNISNLYTGKIDSIMSTYGTVDSNNECVFNTSTGIFSSILANDVPTFYGCIDTIPNFNHNHNTNDYTPNSTINIAFVVGIIILILVVIAIALGTYFYFKTSDKNIEPELADGDKYSAPINSKKSPPPIIDNKDLTPPIDNKDSTLIKSEDSKQIKSNIKQKSDSNEEEVIDFSVDGKYFDSESEIF